MVNLSELVYTGHTTPLSAVVEGGSNVFSWGGFDDSWRDHRPPLSVALCFCGGWLEWRVDALKNLPPQYPLEAAVSSACSWSWRLWSLALVRVRRWSVGEGLRFEQVSLSSVKASPRSIRSSWSEAAMGELAQSVAERGILQAVKVRPVGDGYEVVYGHRRVEAARRAGLSEILVVVEPMGDTEALVEALVENMQREDMPVMDKARALRVLKDETGWSNLELERRGVVSNAYASKLLALLEEPVEVQELLSSSQGRIGERHSRAVRLAAGGKLKGADKVSVLRKAAEEGLTAEQTRHVAEAVAVAPSERAREYLLGCSYSGVMHNSERIERRAERYGAHDPLYREPYDAEARERQENPRAVREYIEAIQAFSEAVHVAVDVAEYGKFSPEAGRFLRRRHDRVREALETLEAVWREQG